MPTKANKGEWGEPYAALRILGDKKLYIADRNGDKNLNEWMEILELIRHETAERIVKYRYDERKTDVIIAVNNEEKITIPASKVSEMADALAAEIKTGRGHSFNVSQSIQSFLYDIQIQSIKAGSVDKSDIFLSVGDPRSSVVRNHIGFSIKSEFGQPPTLFNTAKASATVYKVLGMSDALMKEINSIFDNKGKVAVGARCDRLTESGCTIEFVGFPYAKKAGCRAFEENLDLIDPRLKVVIDRMLRRHFFEHNSDNNIVDVIHETIKENPCNLLRPEIKYPYMFKAFIYAAYCGMTASTLWDGNSQVNGGFIRVKGNGEVLAFYALESDAFKSYLYNNCYLEYPATSEGHGDYGKIEKKNGEYYFKLNFQIRYRVST